MVILVGRGVFAINKKANYIAVFKFPGTLVSR